MPRDPLWRARDIRAQRAEHLQDLKEGARYLRKTLLHPPECLHDATIYLVLSSAHGVGPKTAEKVLLKAQIWPFIRVGSLPRSAIDRILENLPERIR